MEIDEHALKYLAANVSQTYGIEVTELTPLHTPVHDVVRVTSGREEYALKMYAPAARDHDGVEWEVDLVTHLAAHGVPVLAPIEGVHGFVEKISLGEELRSSVLSPWASGAKPAPNEETYLLLGRTAAAIHEGTQGFDSPIEREEYDPFLLIDDPLDRLSSQLASQKCEDRARAVGKRLLARLDGLTMERGICHMDLTLDNVHIHAGKMTVFDFDSAGVCWLPMEPSGVLGSSYAGAFAAWCNGYRSVRLWSDEEEAAVRIFALVNQVRIVSWMAGVARSSRGTPLVAPSELPDIVATWETQEQALD